MRPEDAPPYAPQDADGLLTAADVPPGWYLPTMYPGGRSSDASPRIDEILGYDDAHTGVAQVDEDDEPADSATNEPADGVWRFIEHTETGTRVYLRLQRQAFAVPEEVRITGVVYLPRVPGDPITSRLLRELPTAYIETSINKRLFAMKSTQTRTGTKIVLPSGVKVARRDLIKPLAGTGKSDPDFYERVALQHGELARRGERNPTATMAELNHVALTTAQGWVAKARNRGLLPPGRPGRAG